MHLLSKINQSKKSKYCMTQLYDILGKTKTMETVERSVVVKGHRKGKEWCTGRAPAVLGSETALCVILMVDSCHEEKTLKQCL